MDVLKDYVMGRMLLDCVERACATSDRHQRMLRLARAKLCHVPREPPSGLCPLASESIVGW